MTTMATRHEREVRELLAMPEHQIVASIVALGYPDTRVSKLRRNPVAAFTSIDTFDGEPLTP
jgi:hypothetical protein